MLIESQINTFCKQRGYMADEDGEAEGPKKAISDFARFYPKIEYDGVTYGSRPTSMGVVKDLCKEIESNPNLSGPEFARMLLRKSLYPENGNDRIDAAKADELAADPAFLEEVIKAHPELSKLSLERGEGESTADYLFRAYRDHVDRQLKQVQEEMVKIRRQFSGLSGSLSPSGLDSLLASTTASKRIDDIIKGSVGSDRISEIIQGASGRDRISKTLEGSGSDKMSEAFRRAVNDIPRNGIGSATFTPLEHYSVPPIPPNPIHETNATLAEVADSIGEMRELFAQQAVMQSSLNTVATEILNNFVTGMNSAEVASKRAMCIALAAIAVSLIPFFYSLFFDSKDDALLNKQTEIVGVIKGIRKDAQKEALMQQEQNKQLADAMKKLAPQASPKQK